MNIILIIVDSLRPDHLSINGYGRQTSPNIDEFCREGTRFLNAYCPLTRSHPSISSIMTGVYPYTHGVRLVANNNENLSLSTLPEILQSHGYNTGFIGVGEYPELIKKGFKEFNLVQWKIRNRFKKELFRILHPKNFLSVMEMYIDTAISWIGKNSKNKFFFAMHAHDIHWPYEIPKPYDHIFDENYEGNHDFNTLFNGSITRGELVFGKKKLPLEELNHAIAHYDGGVRCVDAHIGRLLEFLKNKNLYDDTLIILASDHGESLGEKGLFFQHGSSLYESSLKTTLALRYPKSIPKGKIVNSRVQNIDIMPTVLELLDIPVLDKIDGSSLMPLMQGKTEKIRDYVFAESAEGHFKENEKIFIPGVKGKWRSMIINDWKIIYIPNPEGDIFELYNLKEDPKELYNLIGKKTNMELFMKDKLMEFLKSQSNEGDVKIEDLTERSKKLLRQAGYID